MSKTWKTILEFGSILVIAVLIAIFVQAFLIRAFVVPTGSMEPTLKIGNRIVAEKILTISGNPGRVTFTL